MDFFYFVLRIFWFFLGAQYFLFRFYKFLTRKFGDKFVLNIPHTNNISSSSTISTTSTTRIPITNRRMDLHPCIYSRLWLFQIRTEAAGTEAERIYLFRTSLSFRVQLNIVPLLREYFLQTMCHKSPVKCPLSRVTFFLYIYFFNVQLNYISAGSSRWRVCNQQGLPV